MQPRAPTSRTSRKGLLLLSSGPQSMLGSGCYRCQGDISELLGCLTPIPDVLMCSEAHSITFSWSAWGTGKRGVCYHVLAHSSLTTPLRLAKAHSIKVL